MQKKQPLSLTLSPQKIESLFKENEQLQKEKTQLEQNYQKLQTEINKGEIITSQETLKNILIYQTKLNLSASELNSVYEPKDYQKLWQEADQEILKDKRAENTVKSVLNILAAKKAQNHLE